jgi:hypothetical protein
MSKEKFKEKKTKIKKKNFFLGQVIQLFIKLLPQSVLDSLEAFMLGFFFLEEIETKLTELLLFTSFLKIESKFYPLFCLNEKFSSRILICTTDSQISLDVMI